MRTAVTGATLLVAGLAAVAFGVLPVSDAAAIASRVWPILTFVVSITVVTELASEAGLFTWTAQHVARWGRGRAWALWLLVVALATGSTVFLSLDTTAVLLTPVVVVLARQSGLDPIPFAITTVWLANTASLLLPVSNLTNLLAQREMGDPSPVEFAALTAAPAAVAVVVPSILVFLVFRRRLLERFTVTDAAASADRTLLVSSAVVVAALVPALVSGIEVWIPSTIAAVTLGVVFAVRRGIRFLRWSMLPWQLVLLASGLFLSIEALQFVGLLDLVAIVAGSGESPAALLRLAATGLLGANVADNLPAYLAIEPAAGSPVRLTALLIGVNAGPLITPWASLATLLWHQRLTALGVDISWWRYAGLGLIAAPITVGAATLTLAFVASAR